MKYSKIKENLNKAKNLTLKSAANTLVNRLEITRQSQNLHSLPQVVDVVLTKRCNLKCTFCRDYETEGLQQISLETFEKVAQQLFPTAHTVNICSGGEPYMHKQLIDFLRIIKRYKVDTWLLSNGMLLKEDKIRTIIREELVSEHGFSVDGITAATVEAIRLKAKLDVIIDNIKMLIRIREEEGKQKPSLTIRYALMLSNIKELPDAVRYWGEMGINVLECSYLSLCNDIEDQESLYFHQDLMQKVFDEAREVATNYPHLTLNLPPAIHTEASKQQTPDKCASPWKFIMIDVDGRIFPCYKSWGIINMGNINTKEGKPFKKTWNNSHYQDLRHTVNNDTLKKFYSFCSVCDSRFGLGNKAAHLEDETLMDHIQKTSIKETVIANRSRNK